MAAPDDGKVTKYNQLAVEGQGLTFHYGSKKNASGLNGVDINVEKGGIYGLLGPSGCGKTTLLRCIIGRLKPKDGVIKVYGRRPGSPGSCIPGKGVGYMPQELALYPEITVQETLMYFGSLYVMEKERMLERIAFLLQFLEIPSKKNVLVKRLSGGEKRRVSFAVALIHQPALLILDEPTVGVDPLLRHSIWDHLKELTVKNHMTIIITTHYVEEARRANVVALMRDGHMLAEMNPERLIQRHGAQNLEDVFWKLCRKETSLKQQETAQSITPFENSCNGRGATNEDVWITLEEMRRMKQDIEKVSPDVDLVVVDDKDDPSHAVALLNDEDDSNFNLIYHQPSLSVRSKESLIRMWTLIAKSFICLKRNTPFALFQVFVPAFQVIVFCLCIGQEPFDLPIAIVNHEVDGPFSHSQMFLNKLSNHTFKQELFPNLSLAMDSVKKGETWGAMYIGPRFSGALTDRFLEGNNVENSTIEDSEIKLYLDMTNQQIAITIFTGLIRNFQDFAKDMLAAIYQNPRLAQAPIALKDPVYGKNEPNFTEFMAPGMIIGITHIMAVGLTGLSIIIEKKEGLLDRSWVAGVSAGEMIFSILLSLFVTMILQIVLVLIFTFLVFDLPVHGSIIWIVVCVMLAGTSGMGYGLLISAFFDQEVTAMLISLGSFCPCLLLSGILWPIDGMSYVLRYISYCLPLTLLSDTMRSIMSRGWDITENNIWIGCIVCLAWTIVFVLTAGMIFKYKR